jgi:hypothetical protein
MTEAITKEKLEARLQTLQEEKTKLIGAYDGAIQDCMFWIKQLTEAPQPPVEENA